MEMLRRVLREERGQAVVFMSLVVGIAMLGFLALALDVGILFRENRRAQSAADAAAVAYVEEYAAGNTGNAQAAANAMAKLNGFDTTLGTNPAVVTINNPPSTGNYSTASNYFEAVVTKPVPTYFLRAFNRTSTMTVSARAVAGGGLSSPTCICLEGTSGEDLTMSNGAKISAPACGLVADSVSSNAAGLIGGAQIDAQSLAVVSTTWTAAANESNGGNITAATKQFTGASSCSPSSPALPTYNSGLCTADPLSKFGSGGSTYTVGPGSSTSYTNTQSGNVVCYNALTIGANTDAVTLNPGIYVINGGYLTFETGSGGVSNQGGNGVTFVLIGNASLTIQNGANTNLVAPTSGTYSGILFFQPLSDTQPITVDGASSIVVNGEFFAPGAAMSLDNGTNTTIHSNLVLKTLNMYGGGALDSTPGSNLGTFNRSVAKVTE